MKSVEERKPCIDPLLSFTLFVLSLPVCIQNICLETSMWVICATELEELLTTGDIQLINALWFQKDTLKKKKVVHLFKGKE